MQCIFGERERTKWGRVEHHQRVQVALFQLLVGATEIPAKQQIAHRLDVLTSVGCFGGSRAARRVLELFRKPGTVGSSTHAKDVYIRTEHVHRGVYVCWKA